MHDVVAPQAQPSTRKPVIGDVEQVLANAIPKAFPQIRCTYAYVTVLPLDELWLRQRLFRLQKPIDVMAATLKLITEEHGNVDPKGHKRVVGEIQEAHAQQEFVCSRSKR